MQEDRAECGKINEHLFIKVTLYLHFSFRKKNLNKARYSIYGNLLPVFRTEGSSLDLRRNKTTNSSTSTDPFSAATKSLVLCISQFHLRPAPSPPRTTAGHLLTLSVPGVGHLQILGCPGRTLSFWHARDFLSQYNRILLEILLDFIGKTSRLAHLPRTGKNWRTL